MFPTLVFAVTIASNRIYNVLQNVNFDEYHNVPFAAPPVGNLRWKSPKPPASWRGTVDASKWGNSCMQFDGNGEFPGNFPLYQDLPIIYPDTKKAPYR